MRKGNWRGATEKLRLLLAVHHCDIQLKDDCSLVYVLTTFSSLDSPQRTPSPMVISSIIGGMKLRRRGLVYIPWCGCNIVFFLFVKKRVVQENGALSFSLQKHSSYPDRFIIFFWKHKRQSVIVATILCTHFEC